MGAANDKFLSDILSVPNAPQSATPDVTPPAAPPPDDESPVDLADVGKSAAIGVPKGLIQGVGLPGDIQAMAKSAGESDYNPFNWLAQKYAEAYPERAAKNVKNYERAGIGEGMKGETAQLPTSQSIRAGVENVTGPFYEPKTGLGKGAEKVTEFASNPWSYTGAGSAALKGTTAALAGVGSETAGQAAESAFGEDSAISTGARIAGAVLAGKVPQSLAMSRFRNIIKNATSTDELFDTADNLYDITRNSGVMLKPNVLRDLSTRIMGDLKAEGHDEINVPMAWGKLEKVGELINQNGLVGIKEVQNARKALSKVASSTGANTAQEREAARFAIAEINKYMSTVPPTDMAAGSTKMLNQARQAWQSADKAYAAGMRAEQLENALTYAIDRAKSTGKGTNVENAMRSNIRSIIDSPIKSRGFTPNEISQMREIVRGEGKTNLLRGLGAMAPTGIVSGTLGLELASMILGGGKKALFGPLLGYGAKKMADRATANKISDLIAGVRLRGTERGVPTKPPSSMPKGSLTTLINEQARGGAIERARRMSKGG